MDGYGVNSYTTPGLASCAAPTGWTAMQRFEAGEISLGYFAKELGLGVSNLYAALEQRGLPTTNIGARPPATEVMMTEA